MRAMQYIPFLLFLFLVSCEPKFEIETHNGQQKNTSTEHYSIQFSSPTEGKSEFRLEGNEDSTILTIHVRNLKRAKNENLNYTYQQKLSSEMKENWTHYLDSLFSIELIDTGATIPNGLDVSFERNDEKGHLFMAIGQVRDENGWYFRSSQAVISKVQFTIKDPILAQYFQSLNTYYKDSSQNMTRETSYQLKDADESSSKTRKSSTRVL